MTDQATSLRATGDAARIAYDHILQQIQSGELASGARLREQSIAAAAGVSRTPVRQALNRLAAEGLVVIEPNKGAQVAQYDDAEVASMLDLRATMEPQAVRAAVQRLTEQQLEELERLHEQMIGLVRSRRSWIELAELNNQFHAIFVENCGSRPLTLAVQALVRPAMVVRTFERYTAKALDRSMQHHAELVDAAHCRDGAWAESVMCSHILAARHAYRDPLADRSGTSSGADAGQA